MDIKRSRERERGDRRDRDLNSDRDRDRNGERDRDRAHDDEVVEGFKINIEGPGATPPSRNTENSYRAVVEVAKPGDRQGNLGGTGTVRMTCAWQGDKRSAERDAQKLKEAYKKGGFDE